jgi:hypothetical protein
VLLLATICSGIWNVRNKITFDGVVVHSPLVTIATICSFLHCLEGLYGPENEGKIKRGADQILQRACSLHFDAAMAPVTPRARPGVLMLTNGGA